jgi:hypothetical protein
MNIMGFRRMGVQLFLRALSGPGLRFVTSLESRFSCILGQNQKIPVEALCPRLDSRSTPPANLFC